MSRMQHEDNDNDESYCCQLSIERKCQGNAFCEITSVSYSMWVDTPT